MLLSTCIDLNSPFLQSTFKLNCLTAESVVLPSDQTKEIPSYFAKGVWSFVFLPNQVYHTTETITTKT